MNPIKSVLCTSLLLVHFVLAAQQKVTLQLSRLPDYHKSEEPVYLVGSFNNWNPRDARYQLKPMGKGLGITVDLPKGKIEYKFTRGSWETVESGPGGFPTQNRTMDITNDTSLNAEIEHWADHFPKKPKQSTANKNVHIIDTAFFIPQLNRYRRIWIYLPESYATTRSRYPVLYMHDGQNVFDEATSFSGEWGVDESLDTLGSKYGEMIVVAIDNGGDKRLNEYSPYDMEKYGKGEGDAYCDFLIKTLRPYINKHYRTRKPAKYNFIAGSSMGGLISFYAILRDPKQWGGAGIFSPAFWIAPQLKTIDPHQAKKVKGKLYFFAGQKESETMVPDMLHVFDQVHRHSKAKMQTVIRNDGTHSESTWRSEFPLFYQWLME